MPTPGKHKTVQARILAYAEAIGWIGLQWRPPFSVSRLKPIGVP